MSDPINSKSINSILVDFRLSSFSTTIYECILKATVINKIIYEHELDLTQIRHHISFIHFFIQN